MGSFGGESLSYVTFVRTITPLHVGTGQSAGYIDLEIAREKATHWPVIPGSSVKGVLRDKWRQMHADNPKVVDQMFGPEAGSEVLLAGSLCISDQRMLLFPVRSFSGGFAYVTSPMALERFAQLCKVAIPGYRAFSLPAEPGTEEAFVDSTSVLKCAQGKVYLEDLDFVAKSDHSLEQLAEMISKGSDIGKDTLLRHLAVVSDTVFTFLCDHATEVATRVTLNFETKTAKDGGLRTEEAVPSEAVFAGIAEFQSVKGSKVDELAKAFEEECPKYLQFGGKATTGAGLCYFGSVSQ
jgi:CRISPR-associated protein Cmr4